MKNNEDIIAIAKAKLKAEYIKDLLNGSYEVKFVDENNFFYFVVVSDKELNDYQLNKPVDNRLNMDKLAKELNPGTDVPFTNNNRRVDSGTYIQKIVPGSQVWFN